MDSEVKKLINKKILFIEKQTKEVISKIQNLIKQDEFLKKQVELLKTVDGIGDAVAWKLLSELKFEQIESISPKAQVAHAGLSPREHTSGSSVRGRSHISRMGNSDLRKVLFLPALGCIKNENYFTAFYNRLLDHGKPKKTCRGRSNAKDVIDCYGCIKKPTTI